MISLSGKDDTRFLCRGKIDWTELAQNLTNPGSLSSKIYQTLKLMLHIRNQHKTFGRGSIEFITLPNTNNGSLLSFIRMYENDKWLIIHNMAEEVVKIEIPLIAGNSLNVFDNTLPLTIEPFGFKWLNIS